MNIFTAEEVNLISIYDPGNRTGTIAELHNMIRYLMPDENELRVLTESVITKLENMTDEEYEALTDELIPDSFEGFFDEDSAWGAYDGFLDVIDPDAEIE